MSPSCHWCEHGRVVFVTVVVVTVGSGRGSGEVVKQIGNVMLANV